MNTTQESKTLASTIYGTDPNGNERTTILSEHLFESTLDALSVNIAILDEDGTIISVNQAWRRFAAENDYPNPNAGIGENYFDVCDRVCGDDSYQARVVSKQIRALYDEAGKLYEVEYPCHGPNEKRWFLLRARSFLDYGAMKVALVHVDITGRKQAENDFKTTEERLKRFNVLLNSIRKVNQLLLKSLDDESLLQCCCDTLVQMAGYHTAWMLQWGSTGDIQTIAVSGFQDECVDIIKSMKQRKDWPCDRYLHNRDFFVVENNAIKCANCHLLKYYVMKTSFVARLNYENKEFGMIGVSLPIEYAMDTEEQNLFKDLVKDIGYALYRRDLELNHLRIMDALRKSEAFNRSIIESSSDCIKVLDLNGRLQYLNSTGMKTMKIDDIKPYLDTFYPDFWPSEGRENIVDAIESAKNGHSRNFQGLFQVDDRTQKWYDVVVSPIIGIEGKPDRLLAVSRDVTDIKRINRERDIYFKSIRDSIQPFVITDLNGGITHVNKAFINMYGYDESEVIGQNPRILNPGRENYFELGYSLSEYDQLFQELWRSITDPTLGVWEGDVPNKKKDGTIIWVHLYINAIRDSHGDIISFVAMPIDITKRRNEEFAIRLECYKALNELAATRDNETGTHLRRISIYSHLLAKQLRLAKKFQEDIRVFAPLHDIGKVGIQDDILLVPRKLTTEEFEIMKTHTTMGYHILKNRPTLEMAAEIAFCHHERWDGTGYPQGLHGDRIPLAARIMSLADVYDALRAKRHYKESWPHDRVFQTIQDGRGSQFDPDIVDTFISIERDFQRISEVYQD